MRGRTLPVSIDLDAPTAESIDVGTIANNLSSQRSWDMPDGASLAQVGVHLATVLRVHGYGLREQMAGLLYFASAAYVPQPLVPLQMGTLATNLLGVQAEASARVQNAVFAKYGLSFDVDLQPYAKAALEQCDHLPSHGVWPPALAEWMFVMAALALAPDPTSRARLLHTEVAREHLDYRWIVSESWRQQGGDASAPAHGGALTEPMHALSDDLRAVFARHGFDPAGPAFAALIEATAKLEETEKQQQAEHDSGWPRHTDSDPDKTTN